MLYYDRNYVSEGINVNKTSESKEFNNFHYWYFLDQRFKFQLEFCNGCHDLLMVSMNLNSIASLSIIGASYRCNK